MRRVTFTLFAVLVASVTFVTSYAATYNPRNSWDQYRWPWTYGETWTISQGWYGSPTHTVAKKLQYAVDFYSYANAPVWAARDGTAQCEDWRVQGYVFGWVVRVVKSGDSGSDFYAHGDYCPLSGSVNVAQGRHITYTGTTGVNLGDVGDHVHFMRTDSTTSTYSAPFTMEAISNFQSTEGNTATSDNLSAGYSVPPVQWQQSVHDKYLAAGGIVVVGSTVALPYYQSPCFASTPGWYSCASNGYSGIVQTFRGAGSVGGGSEHAILQRSGGSAVFMSRGLYYPYVLYWDGSGNQGMYYLGYPVGDSYYWYGVYRMDFQNGYATYSPSNCQSLWYQGSTLIKNYSYCD